VSYGEALLFRSFGEALTMAYMATVSLMNIIVLAGNWPDPFLSCSPTLQELHAMAWYGPKP